jgi:AraC-like DNA-binding protein
MNYLTLYLSMKKPSQSSSNKQVKAVFHFIAENYHQSISLRDVAKAVGYSPAYLTDLVRRETGQTVNQWIVEQRLTQASCLLRETNHTVGQIAEAVGYQHINYFFRQFRKHYNKSPQAWRKSQQESN